MRKKTIDAKILEIAKVNFRLTLRDYDFQPLKLDIENGNVVSGVIHPIDSKIVAVVIYVPGRTDAGKSKDYGMIEIDTKTGKCLSVKISNLKTI